MRRKYQTVQRRRISKASRLNESIDIRTFGGLCILLLGQYGLNIIRACCLCLGKTAVMSCCQYEMFIVY